MARALDDLAKWYRFNERLLSLVTSVFSPEDWDRPPAPDGGNPASWIVGHVAVHRRMVAREFGDAVPVEPWEEAYARGARLDAVPADRPDPAALVREVTSCGERIEAAFAAVPDAELERRWSGPLVGGTRSLRDGAHFLYFHETYHLGQVGLIRRVLGHPGFA